MKKLLTLSCALLFAIGTFTACASQSTPASESTKAPESTSVASSASSESTPEPTPEPVTIKIGSLKGPTTMGIVKLMDDVDQGTSKGDYQVSMHGTADEITPQLIKGELDVALVPANLASVLYNKTEGAVQVAAVNTLGVLYMLDTGDNIHSVADLKGQTIYTTGKGTTPEYVLNYILAQNGLTVGEDVFVEFKSEATEVLASMQLASGPAIAMLPQPYVTTVQMQMENARVALDMTEEWNKIADTNQVTGVVLVRKAFAEEHKDALDAFLADYDASVAWVNENNTDAAALVAQYGIVPKAPIAEKALPACNITFIAGEQMQADVNGYLQVLFDQNPESVGGVMPEQDFYYVG